MLRDLADVIKTNLQLLVLLIAWSAAGYLIGDLTMFLIGATLLLLWMNQRYTELFIGFLFILILSDNEGIAEKSQPFMEFTKSFKNLYILFLVLVFILDFKNFAPQQYLIRYFIPFYIIALICLLFSPVAFTSFQKLLSYVLLFLVVPNYVVKSFTDHGQVFLRNFLYFLLAIIVVGYVLKYVNMEITYSHGGRLRGIFGNPNGLGVFLIVFFILFTIVNDYFPNLFSRAEKFLFWLIIFYFAYKTGSRNALLAIILFLVFIRAYKWSAIFGFILFFIALIVSEYVITNFAMIITGLGLQNVFRLDTLEEGSGRFIAWQFAWDNIQKNPFLGKGFAYDEHLMRTNFEFLSKQGHEGGVHNTYLILWLNTGLIGLLAFLRGFFLIFIQAAKNSPVAIPAMFTIMFSINFEPWLAASLNPFTILFVTIITVLTTEVFQEASAKEKEEILNSENETSAQMA